MTDDIRLEQIAELQDSLYLQIRAALADLRGFGTDEEMSPEEAEELDAETDALLEISASSELIRLISDWQVLEREHEALVARVIAFDGFL